MVRGFFRNGVDANQLFPQIARESLPAMKYVSSCWRFADCNSQSYLDRVDGVFGHGAVRGPLTAHNADEAALRIDLNDVVARDLLRALAFSRTHQRARTGETARDIRGLQWLRQILIQLPKHVGDLFLSDVQIVARCDFALCGAHEQTPTPGDGKEHAPGFGFRDEHGVIRWEEVKGKEDMRAFAQPHALGHRWRRHLTKQI